MRAVTSFGRFLHKLHHPELRFRSWWEDIRHVLWSHRETSDPELLKRAERLWKECFEDCFNVASSNSGDYNRKFARDWGAVAVKELCTPGTTQLRMEFDHFKQTARLNDEMRRKITSSSSRVPLSAFSEGLARMELSAHEGPNFLTVPRQLSRFSALQAIPTEPEAVVAFDPNLLLLSSAQRPKKLTCYTQHDAAHSFLVKGGDDLRLDQRIQTIFASVNDILREARARAPQGTVWSTVPLSIRSYSVIPISSKLGLVEWLDHTTPLKGVIEAQFSKYRAGDSSASSAPAAATISTHPVMQAYHEFITKTAPASATTHHQQYFAVFKLVGNENHSYSQRVQQWIDMIPKHLLRNALVERCNSMNQFYSLREQFSESIASNSICGYLLGLGDRHLENFLVDHKTGELVAIDFGHAFGTATTTLAIPELMPFRLTPQMVNTLGPLGSDAVAPSMERIMSLIVQEQSFLRGLLSVFLHEPLVHWQRDVTGSSAEEIAKRKLAGVNRKLALECPLSVLSDDVRTNSHVERSRAEDRVLSVVAGEPKRRHPSGRNPADIVATLIGLATDRNILGRTWIGWAPFF